MGELTHRLRPRRFVAAALGIAAAGLLIAACSPQKCDGPISCPAEAGLRYRVCGDSHQFDDGETTDDEDEAYLRCFCWEHAGPCVDGRTVTFCTGWDELWERGISDSDLEYTANFSNGEQTKFGEGYAICIGYAGCLRLSAFCTEGRWYLECDKGSYEYDYVAWDGQVFDNQDSAERYCKGEPIEDALKACRPVVADCSLLSAADCESAEGCYWSDYSGCFGGVPACEWHHTEQECSFDPACSWF